MVDKRAKDRANHLAAQEALKALERLCKRIQSKKKSKRHKLIVVLD